MRLWLAFLLFLQLVISAHAFASDTKKSNVPSDVELTVSVFSLMPFGGKEGANYVGIIPEILQKVSDKTGYKLKLQLVPYKRMFLQLDTGQADFSIFFKTPQSHEVATPIAKVYTLKNVIVGRKDIHIEEYEDLKNYTIALPLGNYYKKQFDEDTSLKKTFVPGFKNSVSLLLNQRTDLVAAPYVSILYHLGEKGYSKDILGEPYVLSYVSAWLQASRQSKNLSPEILETLKNAIKNLNKEGVIEDIMIKYR